MSRYSRQELFVPVGADGQRRIRESSVLLVGCGALGTHLGEFCVRAGVGKLTIVDRDFVETSNLQRQSLFTEDDATNATPKAVAAKRALSKFNRDVEIQGEVADFEFRNAEKLADGATLVLDATDNFESRFLINDLAVKNNIPWIYSGCVSSRAVCMPALPGRGACLCCVLEDQPAGGGETCDTTGIILPAVLQAVAWASGAALKILSGNEGALIAKFMSVDVWTGERRMLDASTPRPDCPCCARRNFPWLEGKRATRHAELCGRNSVQISPDGDFDYASARQRIAAVKNLTIENEHLLQAEFEGLKITLYRNGRAIIHGTDEVGRAKSTYAKVVG